jgi:hypothetical protein
MNITLDMIDYGYAGDETVTVTVDGKRYSVHLENDLDSTPYDADYLDADIESWRNDVWHYVGVIVTPLDVPEGKQFELSDSLWGVEFHLPLHRPQQINGRTYRYTGMDYMIMVHPVPEMIDGVISQVKEYMTEIAIQNHIYG